MESFSQDYRLQEGDLNVSFYGQGLISPAALTVPYAPYYLSYEIDYYKATELRWIRLGPLYRLPEEVRSGVYRANFIIGDRWATGDYRIIWKYRISADSDLETKTYSFTVLSKGVENTILIISFCRKNLPGTFTVLIDIFDLSGSFNIVPDYYDFPAYFTVLP